MLFDFIQTAFFMGVPFGQAATGFAALPCSTALRTKPSASFTRHCATIQNCFSIIITLFGLVSRLGQSGYQSLIDTLKLY
jgi:hypothetical protein